jgi:hypothetical protein
LTTPVQLVLALTGILTIWLGIYALVVVPKQRRQAIDSSLEIFSTSVELRVQGYAGLSERVVDLSLQIGKLLNLRTDQLENLTDSARLRDIGLCAIPWRLLNQKSPADWDESEQHIVGRHAEISSAMVEMIPSLQHLAETVRHHHSPFFRETVTTIESRVLHVVDEYVGRERFQGSLLARQYIFEEIGNLFDPVVATALFEVLSESRDSKEDLHLSIR